MTRTFSFERETEDTLALVPLSVRRKLDLACVKISLAGWQALPIADRRALADMAVDDDASVAAFASTLKAAAARALESENQTIAVEPLPVPEGPWPWRAPSVPPPLAARLAELSAALDDATWAALADDERYVLLKLAGAKRGEERLRAALVELGLAAPPPPGGQAV